MTQAGIAGCEALEYEEVQTTRTVGALFAALEPAQFAGGDGLPLAQWGRAPASSWKVASVATPGADGTLGHWARCYASRKGALEANGPLVEMPFRLTISELPR